MNHAMTFWYRRCHSDEIYVTRTAGIMRVVRDDVDLLAVDWAYSAPRSLDSRPHFVADLFEPCSLYFVRLCCWRSRPLQLRMFFEASGALALQRIDWASPLATIDAQHYQTDWYLDCMISADASVYQMMDADELAEAVDLGLIDPANAAHTEADGAAVEALLRAGTWNDWLAQELLLSFDPAGCPVAEMTYHDASLWPEALR